MATKTNRNYGAGNDAFASFDKDFARTIPPQAIEVEEVLLGALLIESNAIASVHDLLSPASFYKEAHQVIYQAISDLYARSEPLDLYTVANLLHNRGELAAVGGAEYIAALTQKIGSAAHVEAHAHIIAQKYIQRELIRASSEIQKRSFDGAADIADLVDFAESEIFKIVEGNVKRDVQKAEAVIKRTFKRIEEAGLRPDGFSGVPSGFTTLDRITSGWQPSDLIIIAARPSMGKTAFVLSLAKNIAVDFDRPVGFFSLEMSSEQLMTRLIVSESGLSSTDIRNGKLTPEQWQHMEASTKALAASPLFIDDTPALSIFEFRSKARRLKLEHNVKLIVIDYLQLMTGPTDSKGNREQEVAAISRSLKAIAKELDIPIMALSQLNRSVESRGGNKRPQLSDLRESGAIEQDADLVAFIHRPEYYGLTVDEAGQSTQGVAEIIIAKHRNGAVDTVKLKFRKEQAKFLDMDDDIGDYNPNTGAMRSVDSMGITGDDMGFSAPGSFGGGSFDNPGFDDPGSDGAPF